MFRSLFTSPKTARRTKQTLTLEICGAPVEICVRHNARAKRYTLRLPQKGGAPVLTIPGRGTYDEGCDFVLRHTQWLKERLSKKQPFVRFEPGAAIPVRGREHALRSSGGMRGTVRAIREEERSVLVVPGAPDHFERRLTDWLKGQARADLADACRRHADNLGLRFRSIAVRDQRTRWGSCSSEGRLNFSWRLILAPPEILDYVAAHEVAHLEEMNHQPQFWALVAKTCPDMERHRAWLRANGHRLHSYGS